MPGTPFNVTGNWPAGRKRDIGGHYDWRLSEPEPHDVGPHGWHRQGSHRAHDNCGPGGGTCTLTATPGDTHYLPQPQSKVFTVFGATVGCDAASNFVSNVPGMTLNPNGSDAPVGSTGWGLTRSQNSDGSCGNVNLTCTVASNRADCAYDKSSTETPALKYLVLWDAVPVDSAVPRPAGSSSGRRCRGFRIRVRTRVRPTGFRRWRALKTSPSRHQHSKLCNGGNAEPPERLPSRAVLRGEHGASCRLRPWRSGEDVRLATGQDVRWNRRRQHQCPVL